MVLAGGWDDGKWTLSAHVGPAQHCRWRVAIQHVHCVHGLPPLLSEGKGGVNRPEPESALSEGWWVSPTEPYGSANPQKRPVSVCPHTPHTPFSLLKKGSAKTAVCNQTLGFTVLTLYQLSNHFVGLGRGNNANLNELHSPKTAFSLKYKWKSNKWK